MPFQFGRNIVCFNCGKKGHKISQCWFLKRPRQVKFCKYCKKHGHIIQECFFLKKYKSNTVETLESKSTPQLSKVRLDRYFLNGMLLLLFIQ